MKRKLSDLKENECIKVNTLKEAKYFIKKAKWAVGNPPVESLVNNYIISSKGKLSWVTEVFKDIYLFPASDFIKPKRSNSKRIKRLESEVEAIKGVLANIGIKPIVCLEFKTTIDSDKIELKYPVSELNVNFEPVRAYVNSDETRLVDMPGQTPKELEVGKWYKYNEWLLCYTRLSEYNILMAYGFDDKGNWREEGNFGNTPSLWIEATKEEVEAALISEAKRRGFKEGVKIDRSMFPTIINEPVTLFNVKTIYRYFPEENTLDYSGYTIFTNGKWAEIIQEKEIDWSVPQLMRRDKDNVIVQTTGIGRANTFDGLVVLESGRFKKGLFASFNKQGFDIFSGSITLKNE